MKPSDPVKDTDQNLQLPERVIGFFSFGLTVRSAANHIQINRDIVFNNIIGKLQELTVAIGVMGDRKQGISR